VTLALELYFIRILNVSLNVHQDDMETILQIYVYPVYLLAPNAIFHQTTALNASLHLLSTKEAVAITALLTSFQSQVSVSLALIASPAQMQTLASNAKLTTIFTIVYATVTINALLLHLYQIVLHIPV
jgi:hypothetical protein